MQKSAASSIPPHLRCKDVEEAALSNPTPADPTAQHTAPLAAAVPGLSTRPSNVAMYASVKGQLHPLPIKDNEVLHAKAQCCHGLRELRELRQQSRALSLPLTILCRGVAYTVKFERTND